jgi:hypothetical protein
MEIACVGAYPLCNYLNNNNLHLASECGVLLCVALWGKRLKPCCYVNRFLFWNVDLRKRSARCFAQ